MFQQRLIGAAAALVIAAAAGTASAQTVLRSADIHPDGYPTVEAVKYMGQVLEQKTGGKLKVQMFFAAQLGQEKDTIEQTRFGVIDMNRVNLAPFNNLIPETGILGLPFIFRSIEHMHKVVDGPIGAEILKAFEPHGLIGLGFYDSGARSFYNSKHPITSLDDMRGLRIRVQQSDMFISLVRALGANATPMPFGEVYSALQTGVIDGAENNYPSYESTHHYEVAKYYSLTEHSMSPEVLVMSKISWDRLSPADQQAVREAAQASVPKMRELWNARDEKSLAVVKAAGSQINTLDKAPFIAAMDPVYAQFVTDAKLKALVDRIKAVE